MDPSLLYTAALTNIDKTLTEFIRFGECLKALEYPGMDLFINFITEQKTSLQGWLKNPDTLLSPKQEEVEGLSVIPSEIREILQENKKINVHQEAI